VSPLKEEHLESILRRLDFLRTELQDIAKFRTMTQREYASDRDRRRSLERLVENVINAATDVAKIVLAARDLPIPESYRQSVEQMGVIGVLEPTLAGTVAEFTRLRHVLAHQYLDIRWQSLRNFIREAPPAMEEFLAAMEQFVSHARRELGASHGTQTGDTKPC